MGWLQPSLGVGLILLVCWLISENRQSFSWKTVLACLALQGVLIVLLLEVPLIREGFAFLNQAVIALQEATRSGTSLVFGYLGGGPLPFQESYPGASFILAFQALPIILFLSALSALLWHWRILPLIISGLAWALKRSVGLSGGVSLGAAANVFVGMVEAPLLIRPLLARMSRSDLFLLMTCGMATVAGTVIVLYASILSTELPDVLGHILVASLLSVPASVMVARVMVPSPPEATASDLLEVKLSSPYASPMDAIVRGTEEGLRLFLTVLAMLIVLVAFVALINGLLSLLPSFGGEDLTLEGMAGQLFRPYAWLLGVPWDESAVAGALIGKKTILNEFIAYLDFAALPPEALSPRSRLILLYALCGFANPGSLGIMIGGLALLAPERREEVISLGFRSLIAGTFATGITGALVGLTAL